MSRPTRASRAGRSDCPTARFSRVRWPSPASGRRVHRLRLMTSRGVEDELAACVAAFSERVRGARLLEVEDAFDKPRSLPRCGAQLARRPADARRRGARARGAPAARARRASDRGRPPRGRGRGEASCASGSSARVANYMMPPVVRALRARHPGVALQTRDVPIAKRVAGLRDGNLDAGLTRPPLVDDIDTEVVLTEPVAAVLPADRPLAGRAELELAELADEPWVLTTRSSWPSVVAPLRRGFSRAGFALRVGQRVTGPAGPACDSWRPASPSRACRCPRAACAAARSSSSRWRRRGIGRARRVLADRVAGARALRCGRARGGAAARSR